MTLLITQNQVRAKYRHVPCPCTRRHHLLYSAYKRVVAYRGRDLRRVNLRHYAPDRPPLHEGTTLNFWPLCPVRSGQYHKILTDWAEPTITRGVSA